MCTAPETVGLRATRMLMRRVVLQLVECLARQCDWWEYPEKPNRKGEFLYKYLAICPQCSGHDPAPEHLSDNMTSSIRDQNYRCIEAKNVHMILYTLQFRCNISYLTTSSSYLSTLYAQDYSGLCLISVLLQNTPHRAHSRVT